MNASKAVIGMEEVRTNAAVEMSWIRRCPAVRLAVSRTPRAKGRINRLIVSMIIRIGMSGVGVPSGRRWPREMVGWLRSPTRTVASHVGTASAMFIDSWVVGVKVYGRSPSRFSEIKSNMSEVRMAAHLWPGVLIGNISCFVNVFVAQSCRVDRRLGVKRLVMVRMSMGGMIMAMMIRGMPRACGIINWSKKLNVMVRFRVLWAFGLVFVGWGSLETLNGWFC